MFRTKTIALFMFALTVVGGLLVGADMAFAQDSTNLLNINVDDDILSSRRLFQLFMLVTVLSLAPSIVMMVTSFTRIVIVLSFLRTAMGLQNTPPNPVLIALAMFLTMFVMAPTFEKAYEEGIALTLKNVLTSKQPSTVPLILSAILWVPKWASVSLTFLWACYVNHQKLLKVHVMCPCRRLSLRL